MAMAHAQSGQCGLIKDSDRQAYCRAVNSGGSGQCGLIKDHDLQAMCRAETGGGSGQCGFIKNRDMQAECRAKTGTQAQSGQCGLVKDSDRQAYCRATSGGGSRQCGLIKDRDLQAMCRAETGGGLGQCGFIKSRDMQAECRAKTRLHATLDHSCFDSIAMETKMHRCPNRISAFGFTQMLVLLIASTAFAQTASAPFFINAYGHAEPSKQVVQNCWQQIRHRFPDRSSKDRYGNTSISKLATLLYINHLPPGSHRFGNNHALLYQVAVKHNNDYDNFQQACVVNSAGKILGLERYR